DQPRDGRDLNAAAADVEQLAGGLRPPGDGFGGERVRFEPGGLAYDHLRRHAAVPLVALKSEGDVVTARLPQRLRRASHAEAHRAATEAAQLDRHPQVLALA